MPVEAHHLSPRMLAGTLLTLVAIAGCAGNAAGQRGEVNSSRSDRDAASELSKDHSSVLHATEYPVTSAAEGIARGDAAWRAGKLDLAVYLYVQAAAYDASAPEPFLKIASIHERQGNTALAERAFELALERDPGNAGACERLGLLYLRSGKSEAAGGLFERAILVDPDRWQSHNGLGIVADRRGDFTSAIAHYDTARVLEPRAANIVNNRGYSRYLAGDFAFAEADFREAVRLGALPGTWANLGRAQARQGRYEEALESLLEEMDVARAYNLLGEVALEDDALATAEEYFTQAISAAPRYYPAAQENLELARERLAKPQHQPTRIARAEASIYGMYARQAVIGVLPRGVPVAVLRREDTSSLIEYRDSTGTLLTGWVATASLGRSGS